MKSPFYFRPKIIQTLTTNRLETGLLVRMSVGRPFCRHHKTNPVWSAGTFAVVAEVPDSWLTYCLNEALAFNLQRTVSFQMFGCHTHYHLMLQFKMP